MILPNKTFKVRKNRQLRVATALLLALCALSSSGCHIWTNSENAVGKRMYENGNYVAALDHFDKAVSIDPQHPDGYYNIAATHHEMWKRTGREYYAKQAEQMYNQCLDHDQETSHVACYRGLAVLLVETKRHEDAFNLLRNWSANSPASADPKIELARLYEEYNEPAEARKNLEEAIRIDPKNTRAFNAIARLQEAAGEKQQAARNYQYSLALKSNQPLIAQRVASLRGALPSHLLGPIPSGTRTVSLPNRPARY